MIFFCFFEMIMKNRKKKMSEMCCKKKKEINQTKFLFLHRLNMKPESMGLVTKKWLIKPKKLKEP